MKIKNNQVLIFLVLIIIIFNFLFLIKNLNDLKINTNSNNISNVYSSSELSSQSLYRKPKNLKDKFKPISKILIKKRNELILSRECEHVDLVYTWVNGSDPNHINSKSKTLNKKNFEPHRFRDIGGLKYSLRSIVKYAPWINNIYIITANQIPTWFNVDEPGNVKFIFHQDYYANQSHLPTFNSNSIESNFWNLPEQVSNCFLYLNDDIFFRQPVEQSDYFDGDFNQVINEVSHELIKSQYENYDKLEPYFKSFVLSNRVIDKAWGGIEEKRAAPDHGVQIFNRKIWLEMHNQLTDEIDQTSSNKIRQPNDLQMSFIYNQFAKKYSSNYTISEPHQNLYVGIWNSKNDTVINNAIEKVENEKHSKTVCINDGLDFIDQEISNKITNLFESLFPIKSIWEL